MLEKSVDMAIRVSVDTWEVDAGISTCIDYFSPCCDKIPYKSNLRKSGMGRPDGTVTPPSQLGWLASKPLGSTCLTVLGL